MNLQKGHELRTAEPVAGKDIRKLPRLQPGAQARLQRPYG